MHETTYTFRSGTDALLLAAYALHHKNNIPSFVELGCGDGLATRTLVQDLSAKQKDVRALGIDIQESALTRAQEAYNPCAHTQENIIFLQADLAKKKPFRAACAQHGFENVPCVLANPPYYKGGRLSPHASRNTALHQENSQIAAIFCRAAKDILQHHGWFFSIYAAEHMLDMLHALQQHGFGLRSMLAVHTRPEKAARWVLLAARKGAAHDLQIEPSLCLYARKKGEKLSPAALSFCPHMV